jgi:aspartyl/asparaginyl-tRNA synthetase
MVDLFELVAARLADADRLAAEPRLEMADHFVLRELRRYGTVPHAGFGFAPPFAGGILA